MYGMHCDIEYYLQNVNKKGHWGTILQDKPKFMYFQEAGATMVHQ